MNDIEYLEQLMKRAKEIEEMRDRIYDANPMGESWGFPWEEKADEFLQEAEQEFYDYFKHNASFLLECVKFVSQRALRGCESKRMFGRPCGHCASCECSGIIKTH